MSSFTPPNLDDLRKQGRDYVSANLPVRAALLPKSPLRVMSDNSAGLAFLVLLYLQNVADNLLPDRANLDWLTRWANIFLSQGPKAATYATGIGSLTGLTGTVVPAGTTYQTGSGAEALVFATTADATLGPSPVTVPVRALTAGAAGNLDAGALLSVVTGVQGADAQVTVVALAGGTDAETVEELRARVLARIQKPPQGGDADDYVAWALSCPGVTRAWCSPAEVGIGTVTIRIMCDDLRASVGGFPTADDCAAVKAYIDTVRPVTVKEFFVVSPIAEPVGYTVRLSPDTMALRNATEASVAALLKAKGAPAYSYNGASQPAQTIYAAWISDAILNTAGIDYLDLTMADHAMPTAGSLAVPGTATYD